MRLLLFQFAALLLLSSFVTSDEQIYRAIRHQSFHVGEQLNYKASFWGFTVGRAKVKLHPDIFEINKRDCYKIDVFGWTAGAVGLVAKVNDNWGVYLDTSALVPHISYRDIKEGKYHKKELVKYNHQDNIVTAKLENFRLDYVKGPIEYEAPNNVRDIIGGFMYVRTLDFDKLNVGDTIEVDGFFEDTFYDFKVAYAGKEVVKTKAGRIHTIKLQPIMPKNEMFDGTNSVHVWISDDKNKIPVKIDTDMFIGKVNVELTGYEGLRNTVNFAN